MSILKFTEDHEWLRVEGDIATVGITDYAQNALGDIVFVQLPDVGASFAQGDEAAVIALVMGQLGEQAGLAETGVLDARQVAVVRETRGGGVHAVRPTVECREQP